MRRLTARGAATGDEPMRLRESIFPMGTYKTEICRSHINTGYCGACSPQGARAGMRAITRAAEYGAHCQFAHGVHELRPRHFDVKYKTQLCKNYHRDTTCRFGPRCKFIRTPVRAVHRAIGALRSARRSDDERRIQMDQFEFWLVSPSENIIRVEVTSPSLLFLLLCSSADPRPSRWSTPTTLRGWSS